MSRPVRIEYPDAYYHVTSRGNARERIFQTGEDYTGFLSVLAGGIQKYHVVLFGFVLMPNHYHLVVKTPQGNLSSFMRRLNGNYTQRYNRQHERVGHVLQGRYKAILIEDESYLLELVRYIHLNPFWAKLVNDIDEYPYSSHLAITDRGKRRSWEKWYDPGMILRQFSRKEKEAVCQYRQFLADGIRRRLENPVRKAHFGYILGSESLVKWVQKGFLDKKADRELQGIKEIREVLKPGEIIRAVANELRISEDRICRPQRGRYAQNIGRDMAMYLIQKNCGMTQRELGRLFGGITNVAVSMAVRRYSDSLQKSHRERQLRSVVNSLIVKT